MQQDINKHDMKRSLTEIYLIVIVILAGVFAFADICHRVYRYVSDNDKISLNNNQQQYSDEYQDDGFTNFVNNDRNFTAQQKKSMISNHNYIKNLQKDLVKSGCFDKLENDNVVSVSFNIDQWGYLSDYQINVTGNSRQAVDVIKSIKKFRSYKPLPADYKGEFMHVDFEYSKNIYKRFQSYPLTNETRLSHNNSPERANILSSRLLADDHMSGTDNNRVEHKRIDRTDISNDGNTTVSYINLQGHDSTGRVVFARWVPVESVNLQWEPVKTRKSHVVINRSIVNGKAEAPVFEKRSEYEAANQAALKAVKNSTLPNLTGMEKYDGVSIMYNFQVK